MNIVFIFFDFKMHILIYSSILISLYGNYSNKGDVGGGPFENLAEIWRRTL